MKFPKLIKLNSLGVTHLIIPLIAVVGIGAIGTYLLTASHASTVPPIAYATSVSTPQSQTNATYSTVTGTSKVLQSTSGSQQGLSAATYSPNHTYLAWMYTAFSSSSQQTYIYVLNTQTGTKTAIKLPLNEYPDTFGVPIQWYPGSDKLAFTTTAYINNTNINYLHTVNVNGTALSTVPSVNATGIVSLAVSYDGKSLVYASSNGSSTTDGIYSVVPGSRPVFVHRGSCQIVRAIKEATGTVAYNCSTSTKSTVFLSNPGSANSQVAHSYPISYAQNGVSYNVFDIASSPDGKQLAILDHKYTTVDQTTCQETVQFQISTMPASPYAALSSAYNGPTSAPGGSCKGGGGGDSYWVQWSPDGSSLAYLKDQAFNQPAGTTLNLLTLSTKATKQLLPASISQISW